MQKLQIPINSDSLLGKRPGYISKLENREKVFTLEDGSLIEEEPILRKNNLLSFYNSSNYEKKYEYEKDEVCSASLVEFLQPQISSPSSFFNYKTQDYSLILQGNKKNDSNFLFLKKKDAPQLNMELNKESKNVHTGTSVSEQLKNSEGNYDDSDFEERIKCFLREKMT